MKIVNTGFTEVKVIEPQIFTDDRGFFYESYNQHNFTQATGINCTFVQDNHSKSIKNTLRGLHFQSKQPQAKLVRVIQGEIFDVAVDIRKESPTFGKWISVVLSAENKRQLWIPEGFAHGFLVLSDTAEVLYKASDYYAPEYEHSILWNDPDLNISWPHVSLPILSQKDTNGIKLTSL